MHEYPNVITELRNCLAKQCKASKKLQKELMNINEMTSVKNQRKIKGLPTDAAKDIKKRINDIKKRSDRALAETGKKCGKICEAERKAMKKNIKMTYDMYMTISKVL